MLRGKFRGEAARLSAQADVVAGAVLVLAVLATQASAQISPGPTSAGGSAGESFRLYEPSWADFPVAPSVGRKRKLPSEAPEPRQESGNTASRSTRETPREDRLQAIPVRPRKTTRVTRSGPERLDAESDESSQPRIRGIDDLLGLQPSDETAWRRGKLPESRGSTADSSRLRSSLWRRGSRSSEEDPELAAKKQRPVTSASERDVLTGGVRAGAPPAMPGYGAPERENLNAGRSLRTRSGGVENVSLGDR